MKDFFKKLKEIDKSVFNVMSKGINFSLLVCVASIVLLIVYKEFYISYDLYDASILLFRTGLLFAVQFFICGFVVDSIKKLQV